MSSKNLRKTSKLPKFFKPQVFKTLAKVRHESINYTNLYLKFSDKILQILKKDTNFYYL